MAGTLYVVATPIGNLEDITVRALRILRDVALIAAEDTRRTSQLLSRHAIDTPTTSLHEHNETTKSRALVARLSAGDSIALVSDAGSPTISDPGQRLVAAAVAAGIRVEPVPGASAVIAALSASGFGADAFTFLGFPPVRAKDRGEWFRRAREAGGVVVFFEAPHRIERTLQDLQLSVGDQPVVIARELTKTHEELVRGPISQVLTKGLTPRGEFTVVVDIGRIANNTSAARVDALSMYAEFCELTKNKSLTRREVISALASRHHIGANDVYAAIERAKKSVERPT
jgi:16S rRNA (cytidine1402-2'-O)-methyltransferase